MINMTAEAILSTLPAVLRTDPEVLAVCTVIANAAERQLETIKSDIVYARIDLLPEAVLDILAKDFKVDWWSGDYSLEEKRNVLKTSWDVHRKLGTVIGVEDALSSIYEDTSVLEWFDYDGDPYHFKVMIDSRYQDIDPVKHAIVISKIASYKSLRSVLDAVEYEDKGTDAFTFAFTAMTAEELTDSCTAILY